MGNSSTNHSISYRTTDGLQINYVFWDMKGKQRFPQQPGDSQIDFMLTRCLQEIDGSPDQIKMIKQFSSKYKYRFTILHKRKVSQAKKERQLQQLRRSSMQILQVQSLKQTQQKNKLTQLQELMKDIELNETMIKVALMKIDRYISQKQAHNQFISIRGFQRLLQLLDKAIRINSNGTKTNFSNQIEILKFFRVFSDRYPKDFYNYITELRNYGSIIIKTYHPVNTHATAYCLSLLTDYLWRIQQGDNIIKILESYRLEHNYESFLSPFAQTINQTDNILMAFYNMKFINQFIASVVDDDQKQLLKQNLTFVKYSYVLDGIKAKLQQNYFNLDNTTFISMHQKIFKYATKDNNGNNSFRVDNNKIAQDNRVSFRNTLNLNALHEQILMKLLDTQNNQQQQQQNDDNFQQAMIVFLGQSDRKKFNKFILDSLTELQKFSKLQFQLQNSGKNGQIGDQTQQMVQSKISLQNVQNYFTRIKQSCTKNSCNQVMTNCFKNLQYFEKNQWKHLQRFILQELGLQKKIMDQVQELKKNLQDKQTMVKRIIKENIQLRNQIAQLRMNNSGQLYTQRNVGKLTQQSKQFLDVNNQKINQTLDQMNFSKKSSLTLPTPPTVNSKNKKNDLPQMPASLNKFLPNLNQLPTPPNIKSRKQETDKFEKPMRDKPKLNFQFKNVLIQITSSKSSSSQTQLNNNFGTTNILSGSSLLPPPPTLGSTILPPPPTLGSTILPPPPTLGSTILPPPPTLGSTILPPPPSLGLTILPPPPTLGSTILPPPPTLGSTILPPPPSLSSVILPPPPSLGSTILSSTSSSSSAILPPPQSLGFAILPPPPTLNPSTLIPPPLIGGSILPPPLIGPVSNLSMPNFGLINQTAQKIKEKRKPKVPLKACNYTVIQYDKIVGTIFQEIDDTKIQFDQNQLIELFEKTVQNTKNQQNSSQETKNKNLPPVAKQTIKILGSDRWRNAQIILTKLRIQQGQVTKALTECTGKYTSHTNLQSILKISPNQEEEQMIKTYEGNIQDLGKPEKFLKQLMQIPQYANRIKAMIFSNIKQEFYYELSSKIQQLTASFGSLKQNKRLKKVVSVCLGLGNYLNGTTLKGGAWGFKLQTIERLQEVKSNDNKFNAAFYLIKQVWKQYPYPIFEKEQIQLYQYLSKMPIMQVNQQLGQLNIYHKSLQRAFKSHNKNNPNDNIAPYCEQILMELTVKLQQYKLASQKLSQLYIDCAKYYCEDGKKIASDEFGKKMFQCVLFVSNTEKMYKIIEDKRLKEQNRKASKNELTYSQTPNPESNKKVDKKNSEIEEPKKQQSMKKLPQPPKMLPIPPLPPKIINKQQELKKIQKIQQQREKKALQEVMQRRTSKLQAYRMSKMTLVNTKKGSVQQIDFLKGIK